MQNLETIKSKIKELEEEMKKKIDFHNEINNSLAKLNNEKDLVRDAIHKLDGALIAYRQVVDLPESNSVSTVQPIIDGEVV